MHFSLQLEPQNWLAEGNLYWILGIALPVLMVGMAAGTISVNSATHLSNVRRASRRLESWLTLSDRATEERAVVRHASTRGAGAAFSRSYARLWLLLRVQLPRRRYLDDVETIRRRNRKAFIDARLAALERQTTPERRDVGSLVSGLRNRIRVIRIRVIRDKGVRQALAIGVATSVVAFAIAMTQAPAVAAGLAEYGPAAAALAMFLLLAIVYVLGGVLLRWCRADRHTAIGAFAWGSSIPLFLGVNALGLSALGMPDNDRLYHPLTVGLAAICMVMMFAVREVLYHRYRAMATATHEDHANEYRAVGETLWFASDGGRLEAWLQIRIGVCYTFVVIHLLVPPIRELALCGTMCGDLVAITAIAATTLLVPLAALFMDGRTRISRTRSACASP
ncbi:MAG: hypothetical protein OXI39_05735 [Gemmatimonadota bacterium]|uniref:hypothetical protein n=1 Tax=Candidatus Palauibacter scopulicola TaxID=3056741 RepID=UPI002395AB8A|nr:hypothetical protein [Candidatus Palauibacter scopulicola]MDE2662490.1 hypothetical protein [Candidatus Palauibacter scopulicola]